MICLDGNVLCVLLLDAAKLCECYRQAVAHHRGQTPRKGVKGALEQAYFNETVHELEENFTRFRRLCADKRWHGVTIRGCQVGAIKCCGEQ